MSRRSEGHKGGPVITIDRLIEEGDSVVATGAGSVRTTDRSCRAFVFAEVPTFSGNSVNRLDAYHVWLDNRTPASARVRSLLEASPRRRQSRSRRLDRG